MEVSGQIYAPAALPPGECAHWIRGWVDHGVGVDAVGKRRYESLCWELNPDHQSTHFIFYIGHIERMGR